MLPRTTRKRTKSIVPPFYKAIKQAAYKEAIARIQTAEEENNGRLPYGFMNNLLSDLHASRIEDATRDMVYSQRKKLKKSMPQSVLVIPESMIEQSSLHFGTDGPNTNEDGVSSKKPGRPKGMTQNAKREVQEKLENCMAAEKPVRHKERTPSQGWMPCGERPT